MPRRRSSFNPILTKPDPQLKRTVRQLDRIGDSAMSIDRTVEVVIGLNYIAPPMKNAKGATITKQSISGLIVCQGLNAEGMWVVDSNVNARITLSFY